MPAVAAAASISAHEKERQVREYERFISSDPRGAAEKAVSTARAAREKGDKRAELDALLLLSMARANLWETTGLDEDESRGETLARELDDQYTLSWYIEGRAWTAWVEGRYDESNRLMDEAIAHAESHGFDFRRAWIYGSKAQLLRRASRKAEAMEMLAKAYDIFERDGHVYGMGYVLGEIGDLYAGPLVPAEDQEKASEYFLRVSALIDRKGYPVVHVRNDMRLGLSFWRRKDNAQAIRYLESSAELSRALRFGQMERNAEYHLAHVYKEEGQLDKALQRIERALPGFTGPLDRFQFAGGHILKAELHVEAGRKREAMEALGIARDALPELDVLDTVVKFHERIAVTFEKLGEFREAYRQMQALQEAEKRLAKAQNDKLNDELKVRFGVQLKEADNARLRAEKEEADTQRLVVALALALSILLLGGLAYFLRRRAAVARMEAQHNKALAEAEASANQAKSTFLANMSHELRSPLNAVLGFTRLLARDSRLPQDAREDLGIAVRSGEHLYALINQVLDLSKIEAGRATAVETEFHLSAMLEEMADMFGIVAAEKKLQLSLEIESGVPEFVRSDAVKLRQVLINLLGNALKFTVEGGVVLRVAGRDEGEACRLRFAVEDTGPGIDAAELERLGHAFVQAKAGRQAKEGTGLGLAISRGFIELMGGSFRMESAPGQGTTISFELPVHAIDSAGTVPSPAATDMRRRMLAPGQPCYRILVADDRPEGRKLIQKLLTPMGFEVREAGDGAQALAQWESWHPHLVFMDMRMPVMDGREATRRIRAAEAGGKTVIIALTASSFDDEREAILADGCDDFLRKPFREESLFEAMSKCLGVQFVFENEMQDAPAEVVQPLGAQLPDALRTRLDDALARLDVDAVDGAVEAIRAHDAGLAQELADLAEGFDYRRMREVLTARSGAS